MTAESKAARVVLIDALGTLVGLEDPAPRLSGLLKERLALEVGEAQAREALAAEIAFYQANLQRGGDELGLARLREQCAEVLRRALLAGLSRNARAGEDRLRRVSRGEMTTLLLDSLQFSAFPEAAAFLSDLHGRGIRVTVVSNWDCSLAEVLERVGLAERLDGVVASAAFGARKPDPKLFRYALKLLGASAQEAVHVGDSFTEDVLGARAAGIRALLVQRGPAPPVDGVEVIGSLREVTLALDRERSSAPGA